MACPEMAAPEDGTRASPWYEDIWLFYIKFIQLLKLSWEILCNWGSQQQQVGNAHKSINQELVQ